MYPDLLGNFILTLIEKGYHVTVFRDMVLIGSITIRITSYTSTPNYTVCKTITDNDLKFMTKNSQEAWFEYLIEWTESEFKKVSI